MTPEPSPASCETCRKYSGKKIPVQVVNALSNSCTDHLEDYDDEADANKSLYFLGSMQHNTTSEVGMKLVPGGYRFSWADDTDPNAFTRAQRVACHCTNELDSIVACPVNTEIVMPLSLLLAALETVRVSVKSSHIYIRGDPNKVRADIFVFKP